MSWRRFLYSLAWYCLVPVLLLRLLLRSRGNKAYQQRWAERFGMVAPLQSDKCQVICLHAVSVGEVMAARPLIEGLLSEKQDYRLWITTTTPTGSETVKRLFGDDVEHSYLPYDLPGSVKRFLSRVRPTVFLVMETELWPNLYAACKQNAIPLLLLNARLSSRSARRYLKLKNLVAETLSGVTRVMARSEQDAQRFRLLSSTASIEVVGNIKFDLAVDNDIVQRSKAIRQQLTGRPIWCAGSTHQGEEELLLKVHARLLSQFPDLLLILVPRHPERFDSVAELCEQSGLVYVRRSEKDLPLNNHNVFLGDSMGELLLWYASSDLAFIGGSLVKVGGHNPLEALAFGVPVLSGCYVDNFPDMYPLLVARQSARLVESAEEMHKYATQWLGNANDRLSSGQAGVAFLRENRGTVRRLLDAVDVCLQGH
ncbi:MAG: lipid IV(A) 3-deoxy-D-manno-octulosonic acid transferase [Thiolinea sp.]